MSIWDKVSKTAKGTITTIGSKSSEMLEIGKLKLKVKQLEDKIDIKKKEIGALVYDVYANEVVSDERAIIGIVNVIKDLENEIKQAKEKISLAHQNEGIEKDEGNQK